MTTTTAPAGRRSTWLVAAATVACLWLLILFGNGIHARSADPDQTACGSVTDVLRTHGGYQGGEYKPDQAAFDARCVSAAQKSLWVAVAPISILVGAIGIGAAARRAAGARDR